MSVQRKACPHCGQQISISINSEVAVEIPNDTFTEERDWKENLNEDQIAFVESARATGILEAFGFAVRRAKDGHTPKSIEKFFLTVLRTITPRAIPGWALEHFMRENNGGRIVFYSSQGIGLVTVDGYIRQFVPLDIVAGRSIPGAKKARVSADPKEFELWVRTKYGYVPSSCKEVLKSMQKRSIGEFALPRI